jgi:hypothetical protein
MRSCLDGSGDRQAYDGGSVMKKYALLLTALLFLPGCDAIADSFQWLSDLLTTYWSTFVCWFYGIGHDVLQVVIDSFSQIVLTLSEYLPQYEMPSVSITDIEFVQYAAYFLPISETATLAKYLIAFYLNYSVVRIVLRWLKFIK